MVFITGMPLGEHVLVGRPEVGEPEDRVNWTRMHPIAPGGDPEPVRGLPNRQPSQAAAGNGMWLGRRGGTARPSGKSSPVSSKTMTSLPVGSIPARRGRRWCGSRHGRGGRRGGQGPGGAHGLASWSGIADVGAGLLGPGPGRRGCWPAGTVQAARGGRRPRVHSQGQLAAVMTGRGEYEVALISAAMAGWRRILSRQRRRVGPILPTGIPSRALISV